GHHVHEGGLRPPVLARQDQPDHRPHPPSGQIQGQRAQGRQAATHSQTGLRALSPISGTAGPGAPDRLAMTRPSRHEVGVLPSHLFFLCKSTISTYTFASGRRSRNFPGPTMIHASLEEVTVYVLVEIPSPAVPGGHLFDPAGIIRRPSTGVLWLFFRGG